MTPTATAVSTRCCARSDVGRARRHNEDRFVIDGDEGLYAVTDGMGGHGNGEIAAGIVGETIASYLKEHPAPWRWEGAEARAQARVDRLRRAVKEANRAVLRAVAANPQLEGMGATAVVLLADEGRLLVANVGDSRAYRLRGGELEQLTSDHSWVSEQVEAGYLSQSQARKHPFRSVVTRALGGDEEVVVDVREVKPEPGDRFLLCSDGLNAVVSDEQIRGLMLDVGAPDDLCRELVDAANRHGGPDNVTVLVLDLDDAES